MIVESWLWLLLCSRADEGTGLFWWSVVIQMFTVVVDGGYKCSVKLVVAAV